MGLLQRGARACLSEALEAFQFLSWLSWWRLSSAPLSLMAVTSWTLPCDLQLMVTAAEKEPGEFCRKKDNSAFAV